MARYCYQPLENQGIRLLRLMPGPHIAARIECELFHAKIEDYPPYEALSYTWGDASQTTDIDLSGCPFPTTVNLDVALRCLRSTSEPRVLWVDAVCINQADIEEQAAQVRMMWEVYQNASRVVVWLGPEVGDSAVAMENIRTRDCQAKAVARRDHTTGKCNCHAGDLYFASRIGVQNLLNSRWFTRVWVLQEVAAAKEILVACGDKTVNGQEFFDELTSLVFASMIGTLQRSIRRCRSAVNLLDKQGVTSGSLATGSTPILELIERFRSWDATKPVDKLFALLAFSSDACQAPELQPDYTVSEETLARRIVQFAFPSCVIDPQRSAGTDVAFEIEGLLLGNIRRKGGMVGGPRHYSFHTGESKDGWEILLEDERKLNDLSAVLLLRGASRPSVVRIHEGEVVVEMIATPEPTMGQTRVLGYNAADRVAAWPAALASLSKVTDGWRKFRLAWDPFGPPHPSAIKRYVPTPNDIVVQWDAYIESLKDQAEKGDKNGHNCLTVTMMFIRYGLDSEAIKAGTSEVTMTLHKAAYNGYVRTVKLLLDANADVNEIDDTAGTPLHLAAGRGHVEVVKALLDADADVQVTNSAGHTPLLLALMGRHREAADLLFAAGALPPIFDSLPTASSQLLNHAMCGRTDEMKALLAAGIDPDLAETGAGSTTALHCAAEMGQIDIITTLLAAGARVDLRSDDEKSPLHLAAKNGHTQAVKALLVAGADVNAQTRMGATPLDVALRSGKLDASRAICEAGGRTCMFGQPDGRTPLTSASSYGHTEEVKMLLEKGADIAAADKHGWTPLISASANGHTEVVKMLLKKGADIAAADKHGWTPLISASANGHTDAVTALLDAKADIRALTESNMTPLHLAAANGHAEAVRVLLDGNADIEARDQQDRTPLHFAAHNGNADVIRALLDAKADEGARMKKKWTPLHIAAQQGMLKAVEILIGTNPNSLDIHGRTPLIWAAANGSLEVMEYLAGCDFISINQADHFGRTALFAATVRGKAKVIDFLLRDPRILAFTTDRFGRTAFSDALRGTDPRVSVFFSKKCGVDVFPSLLDDAGSGLVNSTVYCSVCLAYISTIEAYSHCSICENGDFDLCGHCTASGVLCLDRSHALIRRNTRNI